MSEPITPEWLDSCGVEKSTRGSSTVIYQYGFVGLKFVGGKLKQVNFNSVACAVSTRQDLRDLLRLVQHRPLVEQVADIGPQRSPATVGQIQAETKMVRRAIDKP